MKKFIFLLTFALFCGYFVKGQDNAVWKNPVIALAMTDDSLFTNPQSENYTWGRQFYWYGNTDSIGFVPMWSFAKKPNATTAPADSLFVLYPGLDTVWTTAAAGSITFDDPAGTAATWLGTKVIVTDATKLWLYYNLRRK